MHAHQFLTALSYGDAIGDYTLEIQRILRRNGYESEIFSEVVGPRMAQYAKSLYKYDGNDDVLMLIHFSIGSDLGNVIPYYKGKKMVIYHNITPYEWFIDINKIAAHQCLVGRRQLRVLKEFCPVALGDSEYNRQELEAVGFRQTGVLPIRLNFEKFDGHADRLTMKLYDDHRTNIIVVGRTIPNKKLEDCLKVFACYQKHFNPLSRLIFAGMWNGFEPYYFGLRALVTDLRLQEVVFTGHIRFEELLAYYRLANVFLTMSEHEGFCVPLLEAFYMNVPVIAWDSCAIPYTAGGGGILARENKDPMAIAEMIHQICTRPELRQRIQEAQHAQITRQQSFPFEETLLKSLQALKQTPPLYLD